MSLLYLSCDAFALGGGGFRNEAALDAEANGMADAFVAQADSPSAVHFNPAGLVQLEDSYVRLGYTLQAPRNSYKNKSDVETQMQRQLFLIPHFYYVSDFGQEKWRFGFSATSPYGLGTDWADDSFSRYQATESDLEIYQLNPAIAYKVNDIFSVGFGLDYVKSYISKHKRLTASAGEGDFQLKGSDDTWGYNIGLLLRPSDRHSIGLSYRSKSEIEYKGFASLTNIDAGIYTGVFPNDYSTDIESKLTLPQSLAIGYAFKPDDKLTIEIDCEWTGWSSVEEDFVRFTSETDPTRLSILNSGNPAAKDWNDSLAYGIGAEYQTTDKLALRTGYLFVETPVPSANFDTSLPDSDKHSFTFGAGYKINENMVVDMAYFAVFLVGRNVTNDVAISNGADLDGKYKGYVNIFSVGFTYKY